MTDQFIQLAVALTAIGLGAMNYLKHRHLERDMKNFPLHIALEISFAEDFQPKVTVKSVTRAKSRAYPSGKAEAPQD